MSSLLLDVYLRSGVLCAFYHKKEYPSQFLVGVVIHWEKASNVLIELIDQKGRPDGFLLFCISDIYRMEVNSIYLNRINIHARNIIINKIGDNWSTILCYAKNQKIAVQLQDHNGKRIVTGIVLGYTDSYICVKAIKGNGRPGEIYCLQRISIGFLFCGSRSEISRMNKYLGGVNHRYT